MVSEEEPKVTPKERKQRNTVAENGESVQNLFSPRFKSVAAMAGWDEEAILVATLVVEDTPDRESKQKKRSDSFFKTPPSNSRRKRRAQRRSPISNPAVVLNLDEEENPAEDGEKRNVDQKTVMSEENKIKEEKKIEETESSEQKSKETCSNSVLPCLDKLREELSCAICLEICFEPSTTACGHSFCKKCLKSAAEKCGKRCPKCRQLISNGRSCTVNTVLWNTIQLLFPQQIQSRKSKAALDSPKSDHNNSQTRSSRRRGVISGQDENTALALRLQRENLARLISTNVNSNTRRRLTTNQDEGVALALRLEREENQARVVNRYNNGGVTRRRRGSIISENEETDDARLALRLQREEFRGVFRGTSERSGGNSISLARANLRAMASRAINIRTRGNAL